MAFDYPNKIRFCCIFCGICCSDTISKNRHIIMLKHEAEQLSIELDKKISDFAIECIGKEPYFFEMKKTDGKCVFLDENNKCSIYLVRPLICKCYPFELIDLKNEKFEFNVTYECPGIGLGNIIEKKFFDQLYNQIRIAFKDVI
jgi:Fe-S-cluster containining protein